MLVMKFGGTSVANAQAIKRVIEHIKMRRTKQTVVVISAIAEATNILTTLSNLAVQNRKNRYLKMLRALHERHLKIALALINTPKLLLTTEERLNAYCDELEAILHGVALINELSEQSFAKIVAYGELLSTTILHAALLEQKIATILIDARKIIFTDDNYTKGNPLLPKIQKVMPSLLKRQLKQSKIVLTQGFIASTPNGITTILGREGSDYSATLIGMAMNAQEVQIWTDVDGIMTADPRQITQAKFIPEISVQEANELSRLGAKVIHPATLGPAATKGIPVRILNSTNLNPNQKGTLINNKRKVKSTSVSSLTYKKDIEIIYISPTHQQMPTDFLATIFKLCVEQKVTIYAATITNNNLALIVEDQEHLLRFFEKLKVYAKIQTEKDRVMLGIVGTDFVQNKLCINKIYKILAGFTINMILHGSSTNNLLLVVSRAHWLAILHKLHEAFFASTT